MSTDQTSPVESQPSPAEAVPTGAGAPVNDPSKGSAPATGGRAAFRDIKRQLSSDELSSPGTQKLILEMLSDVESQRNDLKEYERKYYEADKRCSVLDEKLRGNKINEVMFGVGVGVGGTIIGLGPSFWPTSGLNTALAIILGVLLIIGSTLGRIFFK